MFKIKTLNFTRVPRRETSAARRHSVRFAKEPQIAFAYAYIKDRSDRNGRVDLTFLTFGASFGAVSQTLRLEVPEPAKPQLGLLKIGIELMRYTLHSNFRGKLQTRNPVEGLGTWKAFKAKRGREILQTRRTLPLVLLDFVPVARCKPSAMTLPHSRVTAPVPAIKIRFILSRIRLFWEAITFR